MAPPKIPAMSRPTKAKWRGISKTKRYKRKNTIKESRMNEAEQKVGENNAPAHSATPENHFSLFQLPPELRSIIYEKILGDLPEVYLKSRTRGNLASQSALPRGSRPVRKEFISVMYLYTPHIVAEVEDFDFGHIITFLNRLSDAEMSILIKTSSSRAMTIVLRLTRRLRRYPWTTYIDHKAYNMLKRWVNRLEHPTKRGTRIDASCVFKENGTALWKLDNHLDSIKSGSSRKEAEIQKIIDAIDKVLY